MRQTAERPVVPAQSRAPASGDGHDTRSPQERGSLAARYCSSSTRRCPQTPDRLGRRSGFRGPARVSTRALLVSATQHHLATPLRGTASRLPDAPSKCAASHTRLPRPPYPGWTSASDCLGGRPPPTGRPPRKVRAHGEYSLAHGAGRAVLARSSVRGPPANCRVTKRRRVDGAAKESHGGSGPGVPQEASHSYPRAGSRRG
jgi:hypothetical protein